MQFINSEQDQTFAYRNKKDFLFLTIFDLNLIFFLNKDRKEVKMQSCFFSIHNFLTYNRSSISAQVYSQERL